jgi:hypothetical protein
MKEFQAKLKSEIELVHTDYEEIKDCFKNILGSKFLELEGLESNYIQVLKTKIQDQIKELFIFLPLVPELNSLKVVANEANSTPELIPIYDDLKVSQEILLAKKPFKIKSCLKKLKNLGNSKLAKELANLLNKYYLEKGSQFTSYNSDLLDKNPIKRLVAISKLLPGGEDPTSSPIPRSSELRSILTPEPSKAYPVSLERCLRFCVSETQAAKLIGGLILTNQLEDIGIFSGLKPTELLSMLVKVRGKKANILTPTDYSGYSTRIIDSGKNQAESEKDDLIEVDEEELRALFPGRYFANLFGSFTKDSNGNLILSEQDSKAFYNLWNNSDKTLKILTNPMNILWVCMQHPDKTSQFCSKYSLLLSLWLNTFFPGTVSLKPVPNSEELLDHLEEQFESIENIFESFSFWFDVRDLPVDYFVQFDFDELVLNRARLSHLFPAAVSKIIEAFVSHPQLLRSEEARTVILERKAVEGTVKVDLRTEEAALLRELMEGHNIVDARFFEQFDRLHGAAAEYGFDENRGEELARLVLQVKMLSNYHQNARFDIMDPLSVLNCLQFVQTVDGGNKLMHFVAQKLADSDKYGELFCEMLAESRSIAEAMHNYTVYIEDLISGSHQAASLVMIAYEADPQLKDLIREREDFMSAEEILEYLEKMHPYKMESILSQSSDIEPESLHYPRKSHTRSTIIHY